MLIDCDTCTARGTGCADCVVTVLLGRPAGLAERRPGGGPDDRPRAHRRPGGRPPSARRAEDVVVPPPGWWWSSTRSSAGPSGRWPTSASCPRCGTGTPAATGRGRPPDGLTGCGRTGPHQVTVAVTTRPLTSGDARLDAILVTPAPRLSGLSQQHHGRRVVAVRPSGRRPLRVASAGHRRIARRRHAGVRGEPGTHRSPGVSSPVGPARRRAGDRASLPSPNPSANSVGGCRGRNGEPPHVATPHAVLTHALNRSLRLPSVRASSRPPPRPAPLRPARRRRRRPDRHRPARHRRRRPGDATTPQQAAAARRRRQPPARGRHRAGQRGQGPARAAAGRRRDGRPGRRRRPGAARRPRRPDPPARPQRLHRRRASPGSTSC